MATEKQIRDFALINAGYKKPNIETKKPTHGDLWLNGRLYRSNEPFALLQYYKKQLLDAGHTKKEIKITHIKN